MLSQLTFSNYKSFKDEVMLDFIPENINEHKESLITDTKDNERFLPVIVLYGPNGGGKSTVLEVLSTVRDIILSRVMLSS
ncbi:MAG: AAA family ATPase, partial [bacterium]|nr:AAA family ATPase [bacterium]